ncbi:MAG: DUF4838 domain-containing protein [Kiritimatiellia bacterium]
MTRQLFMSTLAIVLTAVALSGCSPLSDVYDGAYIVRDGESKAAIVIAPDGQRPRMATIAALELQHYLQKMTGARPPIVTNPVTHAAVTIYVGESAGAEALGVNAAGLKYGAYRMVSGPDFLVLLGGDADYVPPEPWPRNNGDRPRAQQDFDEITMREAGSKWKTPFSGVYDNKWNMRNYGEFMTQRYGDENKPLFTFEKAWKGVPWRGDRGGTLNAVAGWLRSLGVRWYMPGELGEVVPQSPTIPLAKLDETVRPDYELREWCFPNYGIAPLDVALWERLLGMNTTEEALGLIGLQHGLHFVHGHQELREAHPEYYALHNGERVTDYRNLGHVCFSHPEIFNEAVKFGRFMYDYYGQPHISLWPVDGFKQCECESCSGQTASELVWGFADKVARELYKSHPDRLVSCGAYTPYIHPPENVEKFPPNLVVVMANNGRPGFDDPVRWKAYWERVEGWRSKLAPRRLARVENNLYGLGRIFPVIHTQGMAKDLRALNGLSMGDVCEEAFQQGRFHSPGYDHLTLYVQSRFLWDADQDLDALLEEYYEKFYGPVAREMQVALEFAESAYSRTDGSGSGGRPNYRNAVLADRLKFGEMLEAARARAGDTVYGDRIKVILDELESFAPVDELRRQLAERAKKGDPRADAPVIEARRITNKDDAPTYRLRTHLNQAPDVPTEFSIFWDRAELVFDVICREPDMSRIRVDDNVWDGDNLIILLESPSHKYYEIRVGSDGRVHDADHQGAGRIVAAWDSAVDVATEHGEDYWRVQVRIPVALVGEEGAEGDPMNYVIGPPIAPGAEWYFNLGRQRPREGQKRTDTEQLLVPSAWSIFRSADSADASESFARLKFMDGQ